MLGTQHDGQTRHTHEPNNGSDSSAEESSSCSQFPINPPSHNVIDIMHPINEHASMTQMEIEALEVANYALQSDSTQAAEARPSGMASGTEQTTLMDKMGAVLSVVRNSFKYGLGDSPQEEADAVQEPSAGCVVRKQRENRALGSASTPVVQAYTQEAMLGAGRPNLRRRGCYSGLVGSYRVLEGAATSSSPEQDEKQLSELTAWLELTTQPWHQHSQRLHKLQAQALMEQEVQESTEPKVVRPQAPSKPKLKTFSMALR